MRYVISIIICLIGMFFFASLGMYMEMSVIAVILIVAVVRRNKKKKQINQIWDDEKKDF